MSDDPCADCCGPDNDCCKDCAECCSAENCMGCAECCGQILALVTCYIIAEDTCARVCGIGRPRDDKTVAGAQIYQAGTLAQVGEVSVVSATVPVCMGIERVM